MTEKGDEVGEFADHMCFVKYISLIYLTIPMELAVEVMASKKCSKKTCKRMHTTKYKTCPTCRANIRKAGRKRKRLAIEQTFPDGHLVKNKSFYT